MPHSSRIIFYSVAIWLLTSEHGTYMILNAECGFMNHMSYEIKCQMMR